MSDRDSLRRFLFEHYPIRGHIVHLDASWRALLEHRAYPAAIRDTLGEAAAAAVLLAATLKFEGGLSLQLQGNGPMHLLLAQCSSALGIRAVARHRESVSAIAFPDLMGEGNLIVTLESENVSQRYQGVVPLSGQSLSQCLETYFNQSEQLPSRLWLNADEHGASGFLLQKLPDDSVGACGTPGFKLGDPEEIADAWRRVQLLGSTLTGKELREVDDDMLIGRLFPEDDIRFFESAPVFFQCRCSRERVAAMLLGLGAEETESVLVERGSVEVRCDFCNRAYAFDRVDVGQLFSDSRVAGDKRKH